NPPPLSMWTAAPVWPSRAGDRGRAAGSFDREGKWHRRTGSSVPAPSEATSGSPRVSLRSWRGVSLRSWRAGRCRRVLRLRAAGKPLHRQLDPCGGAGTGAAEKLEGAAVQLDECLGQRQSKPRAAVTAVEAAFDL